jgi:hypothetical protein
MRLQLFKYYSPKYNDKWNLSFYEKGEIYFQSPLNFNDPWDCKILRIVAPKGNKRNFYIDLIYRIATARGEKIENTAKRKLKSIPILNLESEVNGVFAKSLDKIRNRMGVYSTSCIPDSELMWAHYGDKHKGYMLHFEVDILEFYSKQDRVKDYTPAPVIYSDIPLHWDLARHFDNTALAFDIVRTKSNAWEYEHEFRFINFSRNGFSKIPDNWLKSIVVGIAAEDTLKKSLRKAGKELNTPVYFAKMDKEKFQVKIPDFQINEELGKNQYQDIISSDLLDLQIFKGPLKDKAIK